MTYCWRGLEPQGQAVPARPFHRDGDGADGAGAGGLVLSVPPDERQEKRHNERRNRRDSYPRGVLRGMAQGVGSVPAGQGSLERRRITQKGARPGKQKAR